MNVQPNPHDIARAIVVADNSLVVSSIEIVREKPAGDEAAIAVAFEDEKGGQRRGVFGLRKQPGGVWRPGGGFMGSARLAGGRDVWMSWGGRGGDSREWTVLGCWVAGPAAVSARGSRLWAFGVVVLVLLNLAFYVLGHVTWLRWVWR